MSIKTTSTPLAPKPVASYSQAIIANGMVFTAGFGPQDPVTGAVPDGIEGQTHQLMRNLQVVLEQSGTSWGRVVKVTAHLQDLHRDFVQFNNAYEQYVSAPYPVRTTVGSDLANILVEIDVVAIISDRPPQICQ